jgi:hypothetical protein
MKTKIGWVIVTIAAFISCTAEAQTYDTNTVSVQTFAGYGFPGYIDGTGQLTAFSNPLQIVSDTASNLYVWDSGNARIRKITPGGVVTTFAGGGSFFEAYGTNASLSWGTAGTLSIDHKDTLWLVMASSSYGGAVYLVTVGTNGYVAIENGGLTNLSTSSGVCFDSANNLYYSGGNRIYQYNPVTQVMQPFAGNGVPGNFDGQGPIFTTFSNPGSLACDKANNIYVWDSGNQTIRRIDQGQNVTTIAGNSSYGETDGVGTNATFSSIVSMFADNGGNVYMVCGSCVRKMDAQTNVVTLAGNFYQYSSGFANGPGPVARFSNASGGCFAQGMVFVADAGNNRIRNITFNPQSQTVAPANLQLQTYPGVQISGVVGRTYQIQSSQNMTNWNTIATVLLTSSPFLWIDINPVSGHQFYRAVMQP